MGAEFLSNFMRVAHTLTRAERSLALDADINVHGNIDIDDALLKSSEFIELLETSVTTAIADKKAIISNNLIKDADDAPNTNVHLHDLRMVVAIPLGTLGAVYLDQHIRNGVFERDVIDKLTKLAHHVIENEQTGLSDEELIELFNEM